MRNHSQTGGFALNVVANGKIYEQKIYDDGWIQPAAGDAGGSVGAALAAYHDHFGQKRTMSAGALDEMQGAYLGPRFTQTEAETRLQASGAKVTVHSDRQIVDLSAAALSEGKAVRWSQG